jgi:DNA-binding XRE family transcriptional regulator
MSNDASVRQNCLTARPSTTGETRRPEVISRQIRIHKWAISFAPRGCPPSASLERDRLPLGYQRSPVWAPLSYCYLSSADETGLFPYNLLLMDRMIAFGIRMRTIREDHGYSQELLADLAHLHRTYIGSVERGERNISLVNIWRIANALQVPPSSLFADARDAISPVGLPATKRGSRGGR